MRRTCGPREALQDVGAIGGRPAMDAEVLAVAMPAQRAAQAAAAGHTERLLTEPEMHAMYALWTPGSASWPTPGIRGRSKCAARSCHHDADAGPSAPQAAPLPAHPILARAAVRRSYRLIDLVATERSDGGEMPGGIEALRGLVRG